MMMKTDPGVWGERRYVVVRPAAKTQTPSIRSALDAGDIGLYPIGNFYQTSGRCNDCATIRQALWYFQDEPILVPNRAVPLAGFAPGVRAKDDIAWWAATQKEQAAMDYPPLIWI